MTACGKHGKTVKLFSHPSHSPWKSLRRFPHYHRHDYDEHEFLSKPVKTKTRRNDAQYHYPGGPNQMVKVGHAGIANSLACSELAVAAFRQPAVFRGGFAVCASSEILVPASVPTPRCSASELGGHITPEWVLRSNLRLLCGNHFTIRRLKGKLSKKKVFTGY